MTKLIIRFSGVSRGSALVHYFALCTSWDIVAVRLTSNVISGHLEVRDFYDHEEDNIGRLHNRLQATHYVVRGKQ